MQALLTDQARLVLLVGNQRQSFSSEFRCRSSPATWHSQRSTRSWSTPTSVCTKKLIVFCDCCLSLHICIRCTIPATKEKPIRTTQTSFRFGTDCLELILQRWISKNSAMDSWALMLRSSKRYEGS